jgi:FMN reductase
MGLLAINASHSPSSSTHQLAALSVEIHGEGRVVDLVKLEPSGLLGVAKDEKVSALLDAMGAARPLVLVTPIYRATYSGILKVLFDQFAPDALRGVPCILAATGGSPAHELAIDTGFRSLVASIGGWSVPTVIYATPSDFDSERVPNQRLRDLFASALSEAASLGQ